MAGTASVVAARSVMPGFVLKAAAIDFEQLSDRAERLRRIGLPLRVELHTFGNRDLDSPEGYKAIRDNVRRLRESYGEIEFVVHVPYQTVQRVIKIDFDDGQVEQSIALARDLGAPSVVMHRYWAMTLGAAPSRSSRAEAVSGFNEAVRRLSRTAGDIQLLVENVGHYSILPRDGQHYLAGPLDHFFPWEIADFREFLRAENLTNVDVFADVAHATLSANMFNLRRKWPQRTAADPRFRWIGPDDLDRRDRLHPFDFVDGRMKYLHASDSRLLDDGEMAMDPLAEDLMVAAICSEGLEIGTGNLPWAELPRHYAPDGAMAIVLEVEPGSGETHARNGAQERSLLLLKNLF